MLPAHGNSKGEDSHLLLSTKRHSFGSRRRGTMSHQRSSFDSRELFSREVDIDVCLKTLRIHQRAEGDVSCVVWDASLVLVKYLEVLCQDKPELMSGMRVLELGAGLGLVGLTAATLGAQVTITDLPEAQSLLRYNIQENRAAVASMGGYAVAETLVWGDLSSDILNMEFDYVLLADCVYYDESITPLIETLSNLNRNSMKRPTIFLTQELRDSEKQKNIWKIFSSKLDESFLVEKIPEEQQHPDYKSSDIVVLKIVKK